MKALLLMIMMIAQTNVPAAGSGAGSQDILFSDMLIAKLPAGSAAAARQQSASDLTNATLIDANGNGLDSADLASAVAAQDRTGYGGQEVGRELANDPAVQAARFVMVGEAHSWVPTGIITGLIDGLRAQGRDVIFAYEFPPRDSAGNPVLQELVDRLNRGEISPDDFGTALIEAIRSNPDFAAFLEPGGQNIASVVQALVKAARAGAKIALVDSNYFAASASRGQPGQINGRDEVMASNLAHLDPNAVVVFGAGWLHVQTSPGMRQVDANGSPPPEMADTQQPVGVRLRQRFGDSSVYSVAAMYEVVPFFMNGVPLSSWNRVVYEPDGDYMPGWLNRR